jgi:ATPase subunit of ABC transporter with duplicated ATPase domains
MGLARGAILEEDGADNRMRPSGPKKDPARMIQLSDLTMRFGPKMLFESINARFNPGCTYGIIGANGAGKSTLLKIIAGVLEPDTGSVSFGKGMRLGFLRQDHFAYDEETILDTVIQGNKELWEAMRGKEDIYARGTFTDAENDKLGELEMVVAEHDGYDADVRAAQLLEGLGIGADKHGEKMKTLAGGYKVRVLLAQCLFPKPDILLLDEPTNNLDVHSIKWLENTIKQRDGITLIVSHDRHFLNSTCTHIADVDCNTIRFYTGDYEYFVAASQLALEQKELSNMKIDKRKTELEAFVARFSANASKSSQASSRQKLLEKLEKQVEEIVPSRRLYPKFMFKPEKQLGKQLLSVEGVSKTFPPLEGATEPKTLYKNLHIHLNPGDRLAIIGANGVGKTTLLRLLVGELSPDAGKINWGVSAQLGYFPQDHKEALPSGTTPFQWLQSFHPQETNEYFRGFLGRMLFKGPEQDKPTQALSGGERARVLFAKLMMDGANVMLLDEPTNHLDLESITSLNDALKQFPGSLVFVSHDLDFITSLANRVLEIKDDGSHRFMDVTELDV